MTRRTKWALMTAGVLSVSMVLVACGGGGETGGAVSSASSSAAATYTIGGSVSGLSSSGLVLENNAGNDLAISANGPFAFSTASATGSTYVVTVKTQPTTSALAQTCTVSSGSGTVASNSVTSVGIVCATTAINGKSLPPDPGTAGMATLAGIDSDNDGLRDDIERYVMLNYSNSAKTRAWLTQSALAAQFGVTGGGLSSADAQAAFSKLDAALACGWYEYGANEKAQSDALLMQVLNTKDRVKAYAQFTSQLAGQVTNITTDPAQRKAACAIDPTTLPN